MAPRVPNQEEPALPPPTGGEDGSDEDLDAGEWSEEEFGVFPEGESLHGDELGASEAEVVPVEEVLLEEGEALAPAEEMALTFPQEHPYVVIVCLDELDKLCKNRERYLLGNDIALMEMAQLCDVTEVYPMLKMLKEEEGWYVGNFDRVWQARELYSSLGKLGLSLRGFGERLANGVVDMEEVNFQTLLQTKLNLLSDLQPQNVRHRIASIRNSIDVLHKTSHSAASPYENVLKLVEGLLDLVDELRDEKIVYPMPPPPPPPSPPPF